MVRVVPSVLLLQEALVVQILQFLPSYLENLAVQLIQQVPVALLDQLLLLELANIETVQPDMQDLYLDLLGKVLVVDNTQKDLVRVLEDQEVRESQVSLAVQALPTHQYDQVLPDNQSHHENLTNRTRLCVNSLIYYILHYHLLLIRFDCKHLVDV
jgi:hypothetical protein